MKNELNDTITLSFTGNIVGTLKVTGRRGNSSPVLIGRDRNVSVGTYFHLVKQFEKGGFVE